MLLAAAVPAIVAVYPSTHTVPRRLLRVSVTFRQPQGALDIADFTLRRDDGTRITEPFADPPLWSADLRTVTLLLDPSRQKVGLRAHDANGFVLPARGTVTLTLRDLPLRTWRLAGDACPPLEPARWTIATVRAGTTDPLRVDFPAPIDALSASDLAVADDGGRRLDGSAALDPGERTWRFVPQHPWRPGARLAIHPRLEDPCGDEIGEPFEHAPGGGLGDRRGTRFRAVTVVAAETTDAVPRRAIAVSGSLRARYETIRAKSWDPRSGNDGSLLHRAVVRIDARHGRAEALVEVETSGVSGARGSDPTWRDALATPSAFISLRFGGTPLHGPFELRAGRQRLAYGSGRMLDDRAGTNTIAPFDGVLGRVTAGPWIVDLFAMRPVTVAPAAFDDVADASRTLAGAYAARRRGNAVLDLYVLRDRRTQQHYVSSSGPETRTSAGVRFGGAGRRWDGELEAVVQRGSFDRLAIRAAALEGEGGLSWSHGAARWRAGIGGGVDSGDRRDGVLRTFRAPYPTGVTFGILPGANGNGNTAGFAPALAFANGALSVALKSYTFYRSSAADGLYSVAGVPLRGTARSTASLVGTLAYASVAERLTAHGTVTAAYARYLTGPFLIASGPRPGLSSSSTAYATLAFERTF